MIEWGLLPQVPGVLPVPSYAWILGDRRGRLRGRQMDAKLAMEQEYYQGA